MNMKWLLIKFIDKLLNRAYHSVNKFDTIYSVHERGDIEIGDIMFVKDECRFYQYDGEKWLPKKRDCYVNKVKTIDEYSIA